MPLSVVVPKKDLHRILERVAPVADRKSAVPMLANVLLTAHGRTLRVAATDLYLGMSAACECEVTGADSVALPAKDLLERVKAMPEGPIQIDVKNDAQTVVKAVGQARRYMLHGLPGANFPQIPDVADAPALTIPASMLASLMAHTHYSISTDETRPHVNSALFEVQGPTLRMVSTDGHRLSKMEIPHKAGDVINRTMLIPLKAIGELRRLVDGAKGEIEIRQSGPNAFFSVAGFTFSVKIVDSLFPPYENVIPASTTHSVTVPRLALIDALRAVSVAASDKTGGVKLTLAPGVLRATAESAECGSAADEIAVDFSGTDMSVGVNAKYVLQALEALDTDETLFGVSGELDPMTVRPAGENAAEFVNCTMPMRI